MMAYREDSAVIEWLLDGDPAIRWQTMRDILGKPSAQWKREQRRVATEGWGQRLLNRRDPGGTWGGGLYVPKWISTTYTLLLLRDMGLARDSADGAEGARILIDRNFGAEPGPKFLRNMRKMDLCVNAMYLTLLVYFKVRDGRVKMMLEHILSLQMDDGGWNCKQRMREVRHSSLHTTISVLDCLADYAEYCGRKAAASVDGPMRRAHEFLLEHRLFRSDKTGKVIRDEFTKFSFPPRWHWDVLRGLDYLRRVNAPRDPRLRDAIDLVLSKRCADGRWELENHHRGREFFTLEKQGQPSRWNTMRALRVLQWWEKARPS